MKGTSSYLNRPLRSVAEVQASRPRRTAAERLAHLGIEPKFPRRLRIARSLPPEKGEISRATAMKVLAVHIGTATP